MKKDAVYLKHILEAIKRIEKFVAVGKEQFLAEDHWHEATVRQLEIIGEATKRLSKELRENYPQIPWKDVAGLRDVLIHDYMIVDFDEVWGITQQYVPEFKRQVELILSKLA